MEIPLSLFADCTTSFLTNAATTTNKLWEGTFSTMQRLEEKKLVGVFIQESQHSDSSCGSLHLPADPQVVRRHIFAVGSRKSYSFITLLHGACVYVAVLLLLRSPADWGAPPRQLCRTDELPTTDKPKRYWGMSKLHATYDGDHKKNHQGF